MAMSEKKRRSRAEAAAKLVPGGTDILGYVTGRGSARLSRGPIIAGSVFLVVFVIAALLGVLLIPGWLLLIYIAISIRPPRGVLVNSRGLVLFDLSVMNWGAKKVVAFLPFDALSQPGAEGSRRATVVLGPERVSFKAGELTRLREAARAAAPVYAPVPPAMMPVAPQLVAAAGQPAVQTRSARHRSSE